MTTILTRDEHEAATVAVNIVAMIPRAATMAPPHTLLVEREAYGRALIVAAAVAYQREGSHLVVVVKAHGDTPLVVLYVPDTRRGIPVRETQRVVFPPGTFDVVDTTLALPEEEGEKMVMTDVPPPPLPPTSTVPVFDVHRFLHSRVASGDTVARDEMWDWLHEYEAMLHDMGAVQHLLDLPQGAIGMPLLVSTMRQRWKSFAIVHDLRGLDTATAYMAQLPMGGQSDATKLAYFRRVRAMHVVLAHIHVSHCVAEGDPALRAQRSVPTAALFRYAAEVNSIRCNPVAADGRLFAHMGRDGQTRIDEADYVRVVLPALATREVTTILHNRAPREDSMVPEVGTLLASKLACLGDAAAASYDVLRARSLASKAFSPDAHIQWAEALDRLESASGYRYNPSATLHQVRRILPVRSAVADIEDLKSHLPPCMQTLVTQGRKPNGHLKNFDRFFAAGFFYEIGATNDREVAWFTQRQAPTDPLAVELVKAVASNAKHAVAAPDKILNMSCGGLRKKMESREILEGNCAACPFAQNEQCGEAARFPRTAEYAFRTPGQFVQLSLQLEAARKEAVTTLGQ